MIIFYRILSYSLAMLPLCCALAIGRGIGWILGHVFRYHRSNALDSLEKSLPEYDEKERKRIVNQMYANQGMNIVECLRMVRTNRAYVEKHIQVEGSENIQKARDMGQGVLILTAHLGNWEFTVASTPILLDIPISIIAKPLKGFQLDRYLKELRGKFGETVLPHKGSYREVSRALQRNEAIGFVIDQNMIFWEGIFVEFFGRLACTTPGLAHLSAKTGACVVPMIIARDNKGNHKVRYGEPIAPPPDREKESLHEATQLYTRIIEDAIREDPAQWIWIHKRWNTVPEDEFK